MGAAQGFVGQLLQGSGLAIDAVEPQAQWAEAARPVYRQVFASTIEAANLPEKTYDAIVCADVLEHLVDPVAVLGQLKRVATDDALFIISLPNVAHLAVRMMLLAGYFPKMERGILDRTHLHFFTRDTAGQMLRSAGLEVGQVLATGVPLEEVWGARGASGVRRGLAKVQAAALVIAPRLFAFQWIFVATQLPPAATLKG